MYPNFFLQCKSMGTVPNSYSIKKSRRMEANIYLSESQKVSIFKLQYS